MRKQIVQELASLLANPQHGKAPRAFDVKLHTETVEEPVCLSSLLVPNLALSHRLCPLMDQAQPGSDTQRRGLVTIESNMELALQTCRL